MAPAFPWIAASAFGLLAMTRSDSFRKRFHEKGSSSPWLLRCDLKFESVTPTRRMPFGGGNTNRINSRATLATRPPFRSALPTIGCEWIAESQPI